MPWASMCSRGHIHMVPCPPGCGCGQLHPTDLILREAPVMPWATFVNCGFGSCSEAAISIPGGMGVRGRNVRFRDVPTAIDIRSGTGVVDLDGIDYEYRPPRRERRKKKR